MENSCEQKSPGKRVLIFPAQIQNVANHQVYFLFSLRQMEDILADAAVRPVPFSPGHIDGIAEWRGRVLPVISLEASLGFESVDSSNVRRLMVVRVAKGRPQKKTDRVMLRVNPPIQMLTLPIECIPVSDKWVPENCLTRGVYEWENKFLVAAHVEKIIGGGN